MLLVLLIFFEVGFIKFVIGYFLIVIEVYYIFYSWVWYFEIGVGDQIYGIGVGWKGIVNMRSCISQICIYFLCIWV